MPVGAMIFLGVVLAVFTVLDIFMLVTLLKPGDERNQIIVWKASSFTLLVCNCTTSYSKSFCTVGSFRYYVFCFPHVLQEKA